MRFSTFCLGVVLLLAATVACSDSPTSPSATRLQLDQAVIMVGDTVMNGATVGRNHGNGAPTRFEARLRNPDGTPAVGHHVRIRFDRPGGMHMHQGEFRLYDDGTHGDHHAGDGLYCFEDEQWQYGCSGPGTGPGNYEYEFCGVRQGGGESNRVTVKVTVE
jgi:hypothetical protein